MPDNKKIYPGQRVRVKGTFRDPETRDEVEPGIVEIKFRRPSRTETAVGVSNPLFGVFTGSIVVDEPGDWHYRISSEQPGETAIEGRFHVENSLFE